MVLTGKNLKVVNPENLEILDCFEKICTKISKFTSVCFFLETECFFSKNFSKGSPDGWENFSNETFCSKTTLFVLHLLFSSCVSCLLNLWLIVAKKRDFIFTCHFQSQWLVNQVADLFRIVSDRGSTQCEGQKLDFVLYHTSRFQQPSLAPCPIERAAQFQIRLEYRPRSWCHLVHPSFDVKFLKMSLVHCLVNFLSLRCNFLIIQM